MNKRLFTKYLYACIGLISMILLIVIGYHSSNGSWVSVDSKEEIIEYALKYVDKHKYSLRETTLISNAKTDVDLNIVDEELSTSEFKVSEERSGNIFTYSYKGTDTNWSEYISYEDDSWYSYVFDSKTQKYVRCNVEEVNVQKVSEIIDGLREAEMMSKYALWDNEINCYVFQKSAQYEDGSFLFERYYISEESLCLVGSVSAYYSPSGDTGEKEITEDAEVEIDIDEQDSLIVKEGETYYVDMVRTSYTYSNKSLHTIDKPYEFISEDEYELLKEVE